MERASVRCLPTSESQSCSDSENVDDINELDASHIIKRSALLWLKLECIYNVSYMYSVYICTVHRRSD